MFYLLGSDVSIPNQVVAVKMLVSGNKASLDGNFSTDGIASFIMTAENSDAVLSDAVLDSNNNIIVAGYGDISGINAPMLGRIKPDGTLDSTFNTTGFFNATSCTEAGQLTSVLLIDDVNFVVAGQCYIDDSFKNNIELTQYQLLEP